MATAGAAWDASGNPPESRRRAVCCFEGEIGDQGALRHQLHSQGPARFAQGCAGRRSARGAIFLGYADEGDGFSDSCRGRQARDAGY